MGRWRALDVLESMATCASRMKVRKIEKPCRLDRAFALFEGFACLVVPLLSVVGLVASEYDNELRGFNESGAADSMNP